MNLKGKVLIATKKMPDPTFREMLILIVKDDEDGVVGYCLNNATNEKVGELWAKLGNTESNCEFSETKDESRLQTGGPVFGPLTALHKLKSASENEVVNGIYCSTSGKKVNEVVASQTPFRIYSGYSGWEKGQLDSEIERGGWHVLDLDEKFIFHTPETEHEVWKEASQQINQSFYEALGIKHTSSDPSLN